MNKPYIHTYCMLMLGDRGISQTRLAKDIGVSMEMVNQVLMGKRTSAKVQKAIAHAIGLTSWAEVEERAARFSELFSTMKNTPKSAYASKTPKRRLA